MRGGWTGTAAFVVTTVLLGLSASRAAGQAVLLVDGFDRDGPIDSERWQATHGDPPTCRDGEAVSARTKCWQSRMTFSEPVSVEFSGVYLGALPTSGHNLLSLAEGGWGPRTVGWVFDGSIKPKHPLVPLRRVGENAHWKEGYGKAVDLSGLPDVTKKENALTLRIDWWPGKLVRYYLNGEMVVQFFDDVPEGPVPVGVRDESVSFRIGAVKVTRIDEPVEAIIEELKRAEEEARLREQVLAAIRLGTLRSMLNRAKSPPSSALLLHLDGGAPVKDSSAYGFELAPEGVTYAEGRFGQAARFDGKQSKIVLDKPMIERPGYQYLSLSFSRQTVECWIRPERDGTPETILGAVRWFNPHNPPHKMEGWQIVREADGRIISDWGGQRITSDSRAPGDEWTHIAVTVDVVAGDAALYLNGKPEGRIPVRAIRTGGKFMIGAGDAGAFKGLIDEVAVHLGTRPADWIARRAAAAEPLPDPKREARFHALPANDHTFVFLSHGHLPGNWLLLRLPEYAWRDKGGRVHEARHVRWIWEDGGWTYTWAVPDAMKKGALLDFKGRIVPGIDRVLYEIAATNPGEERWYFEQMSYACMRCADAPLFHDFEATRTFVRQGDEFGTALAATGGKLHVNKRGDSRTGGGPGPLLARRSVDEKYALGILTDRAQRAGGNFVPHAFCMHSNPAWGRLAPGESKTNFGCVFIVDGGIERLWARCLADFDLK